MAKLQVLCKQVAACTVTFKFSKETSGGRIINQAFGLPTDVQYNAMILFAYLNNTGILFNKEVFSCNPLVQNLKSF